MKRSTAFLMCLSLVVMAGLFSFPPTALAEERSLVPIAQEANATIGNHGVVNTDVANWVNGEVSRVSLAGATVNPQPFTATSVRWFKKFKEKLKGEQGEQGPPGPPGPEGPAGPPGEDGTGAATPSYLCPCFGFDAFVIHPFGNPITSCLDLTGIGEDGPEFPKFSAFTSVGQEIQLGKLQNFPVCQAFDLGSGVGRGVPFEATRACETLIKEIAAADGILCLPPE